jgi:transposase InsO family protein
VQRLIGGPTPVGHRRGQALEPEFDDIGIDLELDPPQAVQIGTARVDLTQRWSTPAELRLAIVTRIERTYHRRPRQRVLGKLSPIEFELHTSAQLRPEIHTRESTEHGVAPPARLGAQRLRR